jgi:methyl-accepting chemotaxis protein
MRLFSGLHQRWSGLRVGLQLRLSFSLVLLLTAALGGVSFLALSQVNQASSDLAVKWLPGVGHMAAARAAMLETREFEVKLSHATDASYLAEYEDKMKAAICAVAEQLAASDRLGAEADEAALAGGLKKAWQDYLAVNTRVAALARQGQVDDARDIGEGAAKMGMDDAVGALDKLTAFMFDSGAKAAERARGVYGQARVALLGLLVGSLLIGLLMALGLTRSLLSRLGGEPADAARVAHAVAEGRLGTPIALRPGDNSSLMAALSLMQDSLARVVQAVREGSDQVATASVEIAHGNNDLSQRTEQQASALQQTASSMTQLGSTVARNADNARQADALARGASQVAQRGGAAVAQVVGTMRQINEGSRRIADITGVIDGIAFQTNILALNAAVEAARAGEQGRGFAVVASEVRSLAQRSAEAAREIKSLISASVERVDQGTRQVDEAGATMTEVVSAIERVTQIVSEISTASEDQSEGVRQVGSAVTQMDQTTQQNAALVEQSAAAADSLQQQAQQLVQAVAVFRL